MKREADDIKLMTEGSIWKTILLFSIPLILGNLLQQLYSTVDSIIVGNIVGPGALAAVGASTSIVNLLIAFSQGASVGAGVIIAQYLGAGDHKGLEKSVHTALAIALILGTALSIGGLVTTKAILVWMNTPSDVLADSVSYLRIYSCGLIFNVIYNMNAGILNATGNSRRSLIYLCYASVTNIVLDLVFIACLKAGVAGAAAATDISQAVSCVLSFIFLSRTKSEYRVTLRKIALDRKMAVRIVKIGLPTAVQNTVISFSNVLVQSSVNAFGSAAMAGFGAYMKIDGFNILPVTSFSLSVTTFTGQNFGAGRIDRVKKGMFTTLLMSTFYTAFTGLLLLLFSTSVMRLFTSDPSVIAYGSRTLHYFCSCYYLLGMMYILAGTVRGTGKSIPPMLILIFSMCIFRIIYLKLIAPIFGTYDAVMMMYPASWITGLILMSLYTWKGKWLSLPSDHS